MEEFLLVFRNETESNEPPQSPEQLQHRMKYWQDWMGNIAAQNKLVSAGNRLTAERSHWRLHHCAGPFA